MTSEPTAHETTPDLSRDDAPPAELGVSVVVPVYRSQQTLGPLTERLADVLPGISPRHELVFVCDGSPDHSWSVIEHLAKEHTFVRGINLMRNYGQHNATLCGIRSARFGVVVTMDDDLQHAPEDVPVLVAKLAEGYDVVYGVWRERTVSWWRAYFARLTRAAVAWVMGVETVRDISPFRALRTEVRAAFEHFDSPDVLVDVLFSWGTSRFGVAQVDERDRAVGQSNYSFWKLVQVSLLVLTSYTTAPLRFANLVGLGFTLFGFAAFVHVLYNFFVLGSIPGFSFLAAIILIFGGVQLFALGVIGEYLARVFERTGRRPPYAVGRTTPEVAATPRRFSNEISESVR
ncbi:MAG TPA: glycosyltransferase family 2 protein [Polyangiaceae bacterium]|nr:glycosyltransferase family 2 protein [Polyangiaceae bacterium]